MKFLFGSDFHGDENAFIGFAKILSHDTFSAGILAGDLMKKAGTKELTEQMEQRFKHILEQPGKPVLFIMGNAEGLFGVDWQDTALLKSINCKRIVLEGQPFVGYQYSNPLAGGPFEKTEADQERDLDLLSGLIDEETILVSHGPAFGVLDRRERYGIVINMGSRMLARLIQISKPKLHLHGHAHQSTGILGNSINAAYLETGKYISIDTDLEEYLFVQ